MDELKRQTKADTYLKPCVACVNRHRISLQGWKQLELCRAERASTAATTKTIVHIGLTQLARNTCTFKKQVTPHSLVL